MKVYRGLPNDEARTPCALAIGNFDGVHRGHQAMLARMGEAAACLKLSTAVMTLEPHPREYFASLAGEPGKAPPRIANLRDKLQALADAGVDRVIVEHFNARFAAMAPQDFIGHVLVKGMHAKWLIVGEDFRFGAKRAGDIRLLREAGRQYGFEVEALPTVLNAGTRISSSALRPLPGPRTSARTSGWSCFARLRNDLFTSSADEPGSMPRIA